MGRGVRAITWLGKLAGLLAIIGLSGTIVVWAAGITLPYGSLNLSGVGTSELFIPVAVTIGGLAIWLLSKIAVKLFASSGPSPSESGTDQKGETKTRDEEDPLREFNRANLYVSLFFTFLFVIGLAASPMTEAASGTPVAIVTGFLIFAAEMFGGTFVHFINLAWFGLAWFGIRNYQAQEAWLAGIVGWALVVATGVLLLSASFGAIGISIAGLIVLRYGFRAKRDTEPLFMDKYLLQLKSEMAHGQDSDSDITSSETRVAHGSQPTAAEFIDTIRDHEINSLSDIRAIVDVEPVFIHPREARNDTLTYWSYMSYALGGLTILSSLLIGIELWGFPSFGVWGLLVGAMYLGHGFGLPQQSAFVRMAGLAWYVFAFLVALFTVSPVAILANAGGVYLGWTTMEGIRQPDELLADLQNRPAEPGRSYLQLLREELVGGGLVGGVILGGLFGILGAAVFAWISVQTKTVYGILLLLPAVASGFGVALGVGERGNLVSGLLGVGLGILAIFLGFRLLDWWMSPLYEFNPDPVIAVVLLLGILIAYKLGTGVETS